MRVEPADDLALWRGIDDAVWREALRPGPSPPLWRPAVSGRPADKPATPSAPRIPEPV